MFSFQNYVVLKFKISRGIVEHLNIKINRLENMPRRRDRTVQGLTVSRIGILSDKQDYVRLHL